MVVIHGGLMDDDDDWEGSYEAEVEAAPEPARASRAGSALGRASPPSVFARCFCLRDPGPEEDSVDLDLPTSFTVNAFEADTASAVAHAIRSGSFVGRNLSPNHLDQETLAMEARKIAATSSSLASHDAAPASAAPPPKPINPYTTRGTSRKSAPALAYDSDTDSSPRDSRQITHPYATAPTPAPAQSSSKLASRSAGGRYLSRRTSLMQKVEASIDASHHHQEVKLSPIHSFASSTTSQELEAQEAEEPKRRISLSEALGKLGAPSAGKHRKQQRGSHYKTRNARTSFGQSSVREEELLPPGMKQRRISDLPLVTDMGILIPFIPDMVVRQCQRTEGRSMIPDVEVMNAAVAFADVSGFTKLAEHYNSGGGAQMDIKGLNRELMGAERMRDTLNEYFGRMINAVILTGGDVVKFAGDALMCVWRTEEDPDDSQERREAKLQAEVLTAVHTCLKMVMDLDEYKIPNVQQTLRLHIGVGAGRLDVFYVGGGYKRWAHVPTGDPISQLKDAVENAEPGRLAVSPEAWELLQRGAENVQGTPCDQGVWQVDAVIGSCRKFTGSTNPFDRQSRMRQLVYDHAPSFTESETDLPCRWSTDSFLFPENALGAADDRPLSSDDALSNGDAPLSGPSVASLELEGGHDVTMSRRSQNHQEYLQSMMMKMNSFLPPIVRLYANMERISTSELRRITVLFMYLDPPNETLLEGSTQAKLEYMQGVFRIIQDNVYRYEGDIKEWTVDDKGMVMVAGFGIPPLAHEDDPLRGLLCASSLLRAMQERSVGGQPVGCSIGVTTGDVFYGSVGNSHRSEFAMVGSVVNLAARLMAAGMTNPSLAMYGVVCDKTTAKAACTSIPLVQHAPISVKGKKEDVVTFSPKVLGGTDAKHRDVYVNDEAYNTQNLAMQSEVIGYEAEIAEIRSLLFQVYSCSSEQYELAKRQLSVPMGENSHGDAQLSSLFKTVPDNMVSSPRFGEEPLARATRAEAEPEHENLSRVVVCLEGATGIGKTRLLESTIEMGRDMGFLVLEGFWKFGAMPRLSSRHPIVAIEMQNWIEIAVELEAVCQNHYSKLSKEEHAHLQNLSRFTNQPLAGAPPTPSIQKDANTRIFSQAVVNLLAFATLVDPVLLVLDSCELMDKNSWELVEAVCDHPGIERAILLLSMRPFTPTNVLGAYIQRIQVKCSMHNARQWNRMKLQGIHDMAVGGILKVAAQVLKFPNAETITSVHPGLRMFVWAAMQGNPAWTAMWAQDAMSQKMLKVRKDCVLSLGADFKWIDIARMNIPAGVRTSIISGNDELDPQILVLLRTCSILGECISPTILLMLMPSMAAEELLQDLNYLVALGSLEVMPPEKVPPHWLWLSYNVGAKMAAINTPANPASSPSHPAASSKRAQSSRRNGSGRKPARQSSESSSTRGASGGSVTFGAKQKSRNPESEMLKLGEFSHQMYRFPGLLQHEVTYETWGMELRQVVHTQIIHIAKGLLRLLDAGDVDCPRSVLVETSRQSMDVSLHAWRSLESTHDSVSASASSVPAINVRGLAGEGAALALEALQWSLGSSGPVERRATGGSVPEAQTPASMDSQHSPSRAFSGSTRRHSSGTGKVGLQSTGMTWPHPNKTTLSDTRLMRQQVGVMCKAWLIHHTAMQTQYDVAQSFYADLGPSEIALYLLHAARRHFGEEVMCKLQAPVVEAFIYLLPWVRGLTHVKQLEILKTSALNRSSLKATLEQSMANSGGTLMRSM